jgi:hypothetical protein
MLVFMQSRGRKGYFERGCNTRRRGWKVGKYLDTVSVFAQTTVKKGEAYISSQRKAAMKVYLLKVGKYLDNASSALERR